MLDFCGSDRIPWLKRSALQAVDFFVRLQNCAKFDKDKCQEREINKEKENLKTITDPEEKYVTEHLLLGTAKIAGSY